MSVVAARKDDVGERQRVDYGTGVAREEAQSRKRGGEEDGHLPQAPFASTSRRKMGKGEELTNANTLLNPTSPSPPG